MATKKTNKVNFSNTDPLKAANRNYINAIYQQKYGKAAPESILTQWENKSVAQVTNYILGKDSPYTATEYKGYVLDPTTATYKPPAGSGQKDVTSTVPVGYTGNGDKPGQIPKRDKNGLYSWITASGEEKHQAGYDPGSGSWSYLGDNTPFAWRAAETFYKNSPPPPADFQDMSEQDKLKYLNDSHQEMAVKFGNDVASGQTDMIADLGQAVSTFADELKANNLGLTNDIKNTQAALEASGMTWSGVGKAALGEGFSATGKVTPQQLALIQSNLQQINALPGTAVTGGTAPAQIAQPQPPEIASGAAVTDAQKQAAWDNFYQTDTWKNYVQSVNASATIANATGVAGTGQYGYSGNLDTYGGTGLTSAAAQGSVLYNRSQLAESSRKRYNTSATSFGTQYEKLLGSNNISNVGVPSIGGQRAVTAAPNVLGSYQGNYQTNTTSEANKRFGDFMSQYATSFRTAL